MKSYVSTRYSCCKDYDHSISKGITVHRAGSLTAPGGAELTPMPPFWNILFRRSILEVQPYSDLGRKLLLSVSGDLNDCIDGKSCGITNNKVEF